MSEPEKYSHVAVGYGHIGTATKIREYEDRHFANNIHTAAGLEMTLAIVADGVGGGNCGQRAAQLTVDSIVEFCQNATLTDIPTLLGKAIGFANSKVYTEAQIDAAKSEMSSTVALAAIVNNKLYIANVGDSRVYLVQGQKVTQLSIDHTWAYERIREGKLSEEEAQRHSNAGKLARSVGYEPNVKVDLGLYVKSGKEDGKAAYQQQGLPLGVNDVVLVCSDGLIKTKPGNTEVYVTDKEIADVIQGSSAEQAAKTLVDIAVGKDVDDNVTAVVVESKQRKVSRAILPKIQIGTAASILISLVVCVVFASWIFWVVKPFVPMTVPTPHPGSAYVVEGEVSSAAPGSDGDLPAIRKKGDSIPFGQGSIVTAQNNRVVLSLPGNYQLLLYGTAEQPTTIELFQSVKIEENQPDNIVRLVNGNILVIASGGVDRRTHMVVETISGRSIVNQSVMGNIFNITTQVFQVDCLQGNCQMQAGSAQKDLGELLHCQVDSSTLILCDTPINLDLYYGMRLEDFVSAGTLSKVRNLYNASLATVTVTPAPTIPLVPTSILPTWTPTPSLPEPYGGAFDWNDLSPSLLSVNTDKVVSFSKDGGIASSLIILVIFFVGIIEMIRGILYPQPRHRWVTPKNIAERSHHVQASQFSRWIDRR